MNTRVRKLNTIPTLDPRQRLLPIPTAQAPLVADDGQWTLLAALRFVLAWIVFCAHLPPFVASNPVAQIFDQLSAKYAVIAFLMISGYSIAASLEKQPDGFLARRALRIYPTYAAALLLSLAPYLFHPQPTDTWRALLTSSVLSLLMLQNIAALCISDPVAWSLGVEAWCYVAAPWLRKSRARPLAVAIVVSAALFIVYSYFPTFADTYYFLRLWAVPHLICSWAWLLGFLYFRQRNDSRAAAAVVAIPLLVAVLTSDAYGKPAMLTIALVSLALTSRVRIPARLGLLRAAADYAGDISYPLYLIQWPMIKIVENQLGADSLWTYVVVCVLVSALVLHLVDRPTRRRFTHRNAASRPEPSPGSDSSPRWRSALASLRSLGERIPPHSRPRLAARARQPASPYPQR